jgi:hypothetical protein
MLPSPICPTLSGGYYENRQQFVWLETLDMEPLPRTANLLAAILVRISAQLEYPGRLTSARMALALDELDAREKLASDLQQLELDAVLAWEGTERQRAGHTDPTVYAAEVLASERAGIELNLRLKRVLDGLVQVIFAGGEAGPIFIMPVDDFDLAPTRCLELLRIVRMITTPRLFFLIAGNTRIAESVLRLQSEGELAALAPGFMATREGLAVRACATEIAANNLRKLVPPEQRARLEAISVREARDFRASPGAPRLEEELESILVERNNAPPKHPPISLKSFLLLDEMDEATAYSGASWLGGTPRQVLDRSAMLSQLRGKHGGTYPDGGERLLRAITEDLQREIREYGYLNLEHREQLLELLDIETSIRFNFRQVFRLEVETASQRVVESKPTMVTVRCRFPGARRWLWSAKDTQSQDEPTPSPALEVPRRLAAGVAFLHDLAISLWGGYVFPNSIIYQSEGLLAPVTVHWSARNDETPVRWHLPEWWTLREFERCAAHWEAHAINCTELDDHIRAWLAAELEVLLDEPNEQRAEGRRARRLKRLLGQLVAERPARYARKYLRDSALVVMALLLAPESGGSASLAGDLIGEKDSFLASLDDDLAQRVRNWRAGTFALSQRDERLDPRTITLLSAINPDMAIETAWQHLKFTLQNVSRRRPEASRLAVEAIDRIVKLDPAASDFVRELETVGRLIEPAYDDVHQWLTGMHVAIERRYATQPLNGFRDGVLIPRKDEINEINVRAQRWDMTP